MALPLCHTIQNRNFWLSPKRTVFWDEERTLIVSDLHFGKSGHFRKAGIAIPQNVYKDDLHRLFSDIQYFNPSRILVVGDLFHSSPNKEHELFVRWRETIKAEFVLVKGNHDILKNNWYEESGIVVHESYCEISGVGFAHDWEDRKKLQQCCDYLFSGHMHPAVELRGVGRQYLKFSCFYFSPSYAVLPAFSAFTGTAVIHPGKEDVVYLLLPPEKNGLDSSVVKL